MQMFDALLTFSSAPQTLNISDGNGNPILKASRIYAEPVVGNSHDCFVEVAGVATGATAATKGVIKVLAKPPAANSGTITDSWEVVDQKGGDAIDLAQYQFDGASDEKVRVAIYVF